jgi:outer membrane protein assembly factor BamB
MERLTMTRRSPTALAAVCGSAALAAITSAADWPQWRGPNRDGVSPESVSAWGKAGLKLLWKAAAGEGHASPVIAGGKLIVHYRERTDEVVACLSADAGAPLWQYRYHAPFANPYGSGPRSTPTVDGRRLYTLGATGILHCLNLDDGKPVWDVRTFDEFDASNLFFGTSTSPLVDGPRLLVNVGGTGASVVALDKADGKALWKSGDDRASYASPIIAGRADDRQAVFVTFREVSSFRPHTGQKLWSVPLKAKNDENAITPVAAGDLVVVSSISGGLMGLRPTVKDGRPAVETVWHNKAVSCYFSSPVLVGDLLFAIHGGPPTKLSCVQVKTGRVLWTEGNMGLLHASLLVVGGRLLVLNDVGNLLLIEASGDGYKESAKAAVCGSTWVHHVVCNGRLYVKDAEGVKCYELK